MRASPDYLPTPCQIASACAEIRDRWTPAERRRRAVGHHHDDHREAWLPPLIDTSLCNSRVRRVAMEQQV
jgi:hypothetical protein